MFLLLTIEDSPVAFPDRFDVSAIGGGGFAFIGTTAFSGGAAQVRYFQDAPGNTTTVLVSPAGNNAAPMSIVLDGLITLTADDFIL